ncbi:hypothetical protein TrVFT333_004453 [Trichoderma virens FT-333]|nr:hypothetical protein TrVFT333_004453 [Trichoderma virens FT-333]
MPPKQAINFMRTRITFPGHFLLFAAVASHCAVSRLRLIRTVRPHQPQAEPRQSPGTRRRGYAHHPDAAWALNGPCEDTPHTAPTATLLFLPVRSPYSWTTNGFFCLCRLSPSLKAAPALLLRLGLDVVFCRPQTKLFSYRYCAVFPRCRYAALRQPRCSALQSQPPEQRPAQLFSPSSISAVSALPRQLDASLQQVRHLRCSATPAVANFLLSAITDRRRRLQRHLTHRQASTSASLAAAFSNSLRRANMNPNVGMANMTPMGGPVGGAPMPMMNNGAMNPQIAAAAAARQQQASENQRGVLNTYIYEYFLRHQMFDCARSLLNSDQQVNVNKDAAGRRENGNAMNGVDDPMDTDSKDDGDSKLPDDLPPPKLPMPASDTSFLYEWFCVFWDIYTAPRVKGGSGMVNQYVQHTQQQQRMKQTQQQEMLRQMRPDLAAQQQYQAHFMRNMQNNNMAMTMKQNNLARAAMANNQKSAIVSRVGENAPSPSKRPRLEGAPFNANQPNAMMANGRPGQVMPGQQMGVAGNVANAQQVLAANGINPAQLNPQQMQNFANTPPAAQQKSIATYSHNLQQHHGNQMGNKQIPGVGGPQNQSSPMMPQGPDGNTLNAFYNPEMGGPGAMRQGGPAGAQAAAAGSNHALQDYQMQLMLLEQQNKKRLMMARQEQSDMGGIPRDGQPGAPGPNGPFPDTSPQAMRSGTSPNPAEQMKRGTPQMNNSGIPSPVPDGGQSRESPNAMNFLGNHVDVNMAPHFYKGVDGGNMAQAQMNDGASGNAARPASSDNSAAAIYASTLGTSCRGGQHKQQDDCLAPAGFSSSPTPSQANKAAPKKKDTKNAKDKRAAAQKKTNQNLNNAAATAAENGAEADAAAPATPITPVVGGAFKGAQAGGPVPNATAAAATTGVPAPAAAASAPVPPQAAPVPQPTHDLTQNNALGGMDNFNIPDFGMELANPLHSDNVLNDFDFDSFLNDNDAGNEPFDFTGPYSGMEGGEISAE